MAANTLETAVKSLELSFQLPRNLSSILHAHLTTLNGCVMLHLTTTTIGESASSMAPLGSFVYAMPNRSGARSAISTPINTSGSSIDYATRLSKILAIKLDKPVYVGCSINFAGTTTDEEMEGLMKVVEEVMKAIEE